MGTDDGVCTSVFVEHHGQRLHGCVIAGCTGCLDRSQGRQCFTGSADRYYRALAPKRFNDELFEGDGDVGRECRVGVGFVRPECAQQNDRWSRIVGQHIGRIGGTDTAPPLAPARQRWNCQSFETCPRLRIDSQEYLLH